MADEVVEFTSEDDVESAVTVGELGESVLWGTDWTVETLIAQLKRGNIELNPRFQRRDAWSKGTKSRFIESLVLGLPIPQLVLAESRDQRGRYIILDGKQRLLSLMQYSGISEDKNSKFALSGLDIRKDLIRKRYANLERDPLLKRDLDALLTHTVRTTVIRNWPSISFLHVVFQRLNTGSLKLSAQELRQAVVPGPFTDHADDATIGSAQVQSLLGRTDPDPRMRDVELLVRFLSFRLSLPTYAGRMKEFLDSVCGRFNQQWDVVKDSVAAETVEFDAAIQTLRDVFGDDGIARKHGSRLFNRSIFDVLAYYAAQPALRAAMAAHAADVKDAYSDLVQVQAFQDAVDSDTAGMPHTVTRFQMWGQCLAAVIGVPVTIPTAAPNADNELRFLA